jgi:hypothetical protein
MNPNEKLALTKQNQKHFTAQQNTNNKYGGCLDRMH